MISNFESSVYSEEVFPVSEQEHDEVMQMSADASTPRRNRGQFKKGHDPRRHKFTTDECSAGFWNAIESIITRYPDAVMRDGRHIAVNFLKSKRREVIH